jgi:hypothetical protein
VVTLYIELRSTLLYSLFVWFRCHSLLSPWSSDDDEPDPEDDEKVISELESDSEPFRRRASRLATRNRNRTARRGVTANGSAAAAAETE